MVTFGMNYIQRIKKISWKTWAYAPVVSYYTTNKNKTNWIKQMNKPKNKKRCIIISRFSIYLFLVLFIIRLGLVWWEYA